MSKASIPHRDRSYNYQRVRDHAAQCLDGMLDGIAGRAAAMGTFLSPEALAGYEARANSARNTISVCDENIAWLAASR